MNRYFLLLPFLFFLSCATNAQPGSLERAKVWFSTAFPNAEMAEWSTRDDGYVVSCYDLATNRSVEVVFNRRGRWQKTTLSLESDQLQEKILSFVKENFENYFITAYEMKIRKKSDQIGLVVDTPDMIYTLLFDSKGRLVERYQEGIDG